MATIRITKTQLKQLITEAVNDQFAGMADEEIDKMFRLPLGTTAWISGNKSKNENISSENSPTLPSRSRFQIIPTASGTESLNAKLEPVNMALNLGLERLINLQRNLKNLSDDAQDEKIPRSRLVFGAKTQELDANTVETAIYDAKKKLKNVNCN